MKVIKLLELGAEMLKMMSANDIKVGDECFISLYNDYEAMRNEGEKYSVAMILLAEKYNISESSVSRIVRRLSRDVTI